MILLMMDVTHSAWCPLVPKIPSTTVVDLARSVAPDLPHKIVGIRPGEKLHETMVAEDDGRSTIEIPDRFAILPALDQKLMEAWLDRGANTVEEGFYYASNRNPERLDARGLHSMLKMAYPGIPTEPLPELTTSKLNKSA